MTDTLIPVTTRKDWSSDQEVRWCPGCGDYSILAAVQLLMPDLGIRRSVKPQQLPRASLDYLSPRSRIAYFFESAGPQPMPPGEMAA